MKRHFNYNFISKTILGSQTNINKANAGIDPQYSELSSMLAQHPDFIVRAKSYNINASKKTYHNLTIDNMREYIKTQPVSNEEKAEKLQELELVIKVAKAKGAVYPLTKRWFLENYPNYKNNNIDVINAKTEVNKINDIA